MTDQSNSPSGSRWEPAAGGTEAPAQQETSAAPPAAPPAAPLDDPAAEERRAQLRGRAILAGAATALTLGGGLTGFVIGHATAGDGSDDLRQANFSNRGPGGQLGEGQQRPPSFRSDDGDGEGFGPPQGFDGGSSGDSNGSGDSGDSGTGATGSNT